MGNGYICKCNKCDNTFRVLLGIGFNFPDIYWETVEKMKKGRYGEQGRIFFKNHPDGAVSCENIVACCTSCGEYLDIPELNMYIPKKDYDISKAEPKGRWSVAMPFEGEEYVSWPDLEKHYNLYEQYKHKCPKCHAVAEVIPDFEKKLFAGELMCAKCGGTLKPVNIFMWD